MTNKDVSPNGNADMVGGSLRRLLVFQFKLAVDALRDFFLSPVSIVAFMIDAVTKPVPQRSLYARLMRFGHRSDRMINLFDDHRDPTEFTIDRAVDEVEGLLRPQEEPPKKD